MSPNQIEALHLLGIYTNYKYDFWILSGNAKASCRSHIMSALMGKKVPQSKSRVNVMRDEFYKLTNADGECQASQQDNFVKWAKENKNEGFAAKKG